MCSPCILHDLGAHLRGDGVEMGTKLLVLTLYDADRSKLPLWLDNAKIINQP